MLLFGINTKSEENMLYTRKSKELAENAKNYSNAKKANDVVKFAGN